MNRIAAKITGNIANFDVPVIEHGTAVSRIFGQNTVVVETAFDIADCSLIIINGTAFYSVNGVPPLAGVNFDMWQFTDDAEVKGVIGMVNADCLFNEEIMK